MNCLTKKVISMSNKSNNYSIFSINCHNNSRNTSNLINSSKSKNNYNSSLRMSSMINHLPLSSNNQAYNCVTNVVRAYSVKNTNLKDNKTWLLNCKRETIRSIFKHIKLRNRKRSRFNNYEIIIK